MGTNNYSDDFKRLRALEAENATLQKLLEGRMME